MIGCCTGNCICLCMANTSARIWADALYRRGVQATASMLGTKNLLQKPDLDHSENTEPKRESHPLVVERRTAS